MRALRENKESLITRLYAFSVKHKGDDYAAEALMSFFRGDCIHLRDKHGRCELCGDKQNPN
jgi:hypothetical protein